VQALLADAAIFVRSHDLPGDKFTLQELDLSERDVLILSDGEY
jgi:hypothetical protein